MTEAEGTAITTEQFLEFLKKLPWCKQGTDVLVAVDKATPEIIDMFKDHELKVFPTAMTIKMNKSMLKEFQEKHADGMPLPVVVVWKTDGVYIWYRRHKSADFPYDGWTNAEAAAYERERVFIPAGEFGADYGPSHTDACGKSKECPTMIPPH